MAKRKTDDAALIDEELPSADVESAPIATDRQLATIATLVRTERTLAGRIARATEELAMLGQAHDQLVETDLPEALLAAGYEAPTKGLVVSGCSIAFTIGYAGSISEENKPAAFAYLAKIKADDMIKTEIRIDAGKGQQKFVAAVVAFLKKQKKAVFKSGPPKRYVHSSTLGAFVRETYHAGRELPACFGVYVKREAKVIPIAGVPEMPTAGRG